MNLKVFFKSMIMDYTIGQIMNMFGDNVYLCWIDDAEIQSYRNTVIGEINPPDFDGNIRSFYGGYADLGDGRTALLYTEAMGDGPNRLHIQVGIRHGNSVKQIKE